MTVYKLNGSQASMAPTEIEWSFPSVSVGLKGKPTYSRYANVTMSFDEGGSPPFVREWLDTVSSGSFSIQMPGYGAGGGSFAQFQTAYGEIIQWPTLQSIAFGEFSIIIRGLLI